MSAVEKVRKARAERGELPAPLTVVDPAAPPPAPPMFHRCPDLVAVILQRASEGFESVTIGGEELIRLRRGAAAFVTGAPGSGKTSLVLGAAIEHARERGPVVFCSLEMDGDELAARGIGMQCDASWEDVLCGRVQREDMDRALAMPRLVVLDGDSATLAEVERTVELLRAESPNDPIMVVVDYIQIVPGEGDIRARVAATAQAIRRMAKRLRVIVLAISQPSRSAGRALNSGELVGADTMTAMAESAEIERAAYITLALGSKGPQREDGTCSLEMSIGKGRMGGGDRVQRLSFDGRTGRMRIDGEARPASEVKAERQNETDTRKVAAMVLTVTAFMQAATQPKFATEIRSDLAADRGLVYAAIRQLESAGDLVRVQAKKRGGVLPLWPTARLEGSRWRAAEGDLA